MTSISKIIGAILAAPGKLIGKFVSSVMYPGDEKTETISSKDEYNVKCDKIVEVASDVLVVNHATMWFLQFLLYRYVRGYRNALIGNAASRDAKIASRFSRKKTNEELVNAKV